MAQLHVQQFLPNEVGDPVHRMIGTYYLWLTGTTTGWKIHKYLHKTAWKEGNPWIYERATAEAAFTPVQSAPKPVR